MTKYLFPWFSYYVNQVRNTNILKRICKYKGQAYAGDEFWYHINPIREVSKIKTSRNFSISTHHFKTWMNSIEAHKLCQANIEASCFDVF